MEVGIRKWDKDDAETLCEVVNNADRRYLRVIGGGKYSLRDAKKYLRTFLESDDNANLFRAITLDGKVVGVISIESGRDSATAIDAALGYYLDSNYVGHGIASKAVRLMVDEAFKLTDIVRLTAYVCTLNEPSMRVLEKNGFTKEGVMRSAAKLDIGIVDVALFSLLRSDYEAHII